MVNAPLRIQLAAQSAIKFWPDFDQAATIVAIGGPESQHREDAAGDPWTIFPVWQQNDYRAFACGPYTAFGWLQVNLRWNTAHVARFTGSQDPCTNAAYLKHYDNCSRVGRIIFDNQGFGAWSAYNNGAYLDWLVLAQVAVEQLLPGQQIPSPPFPGIPPDRALAPPGTARTPPASAHTPPGL